MTEKTAIKVLNVSKSFKLPHEKQNSIKGALINFRKRGYEKQEALKNICFEVKKGDFFGIVGRNGSGKSTMLKLLAGIYSPDEGSIAINGKLTPFIELGVGFNPELTGRENVYLNGALLGFNRKEMEAMYGEIVEFAELERFMDQKLKNYSSGMQVRLAFSIAIRAQSDILLLDEVLAVGDAAFQQKCYSYFEQLKSRGETVVFVSHDMGAVRRFCSKAIYIKDGELVLSGTPEEVAELYVAENIQDTSSNTGAAPEQPSNLHGIEARITKQTQNEVVYEIDYASKDKTELYVGISLLWEGRSIAETTTRPDRPFTGNGHVTYTLRTDMLNAGSYRLDAALFTAKDRGLIAINHVKNNFQIKGADITRGAALKLADTWQSDRKAGKRGKN